MMNNVMKKVNLNIRIILPGGAGLVGQNLLVRLIAKGYSNIVVIDKHKKNLQILKSLMPNVSTIFADLSKPGLWQKEFKGADVVIMLQAQIGGNDYSEFVRNNVDASKLILDVIKKYNVPKLVHISSSVVNSVAEDFYTNTKKDQEKLVIESGINCPILRPTLMFGWFDRKHLGWLSRFMKKMPFFPIPGDGKFMRQPLYVGDFCNVIVSCIENNITTGIYNITGHEQIDYIDIIHKIKLVTKAKTVVAKIPYDLFFVLLWTWGLFDNNPPFTTQQLKALTAKDEFEVINWPDIFGVPYTSFSDAIHETFSHPKYSKVVLEF
jgi:nucleoside-diphosphate-sugar epimerase